MDEELKIYLEEMKAEMKGFNGGLLELKADFKADMHDLKAEMKGDLKAGLSGLRHELKGDLVDLKRDMRDNMKGELIDLKREMFEHTETVETRLLNEFWKWAKTSDSRYRQGTSAVGFLDERVQAVEDRVSELERRKAG